MTGTITAVCISLAKGECKTPPVPCCVRRRSTRLASPSSGRCSTSWRASWRSGSSFCASPCATRGGRLIASSAGDQNTGILSTMLRANGIVILPAERDRFEAGDEVDVLLL